MYVNFVTKLIPGAWTESYGAVVPEQLRERGCTVTMFDSDEIPSNPPDCDVWFMSGAGDYALGNVMALAKHRKERVVAHVHNGPEQTGFVDWESNEENWRQFGKLVEGIDVLFLNTEDHRLKMMKYWGLDGTRPSMAVTGFPIDTSTFRAASNGGSGIVVPGRLNYLKQPLLAAQILEPWKRLVTFSSGQALDECPHAFELARVLKRGGFRVVEARGEDYVQLLRGSRVVFNCSYVESACTALVEAVASGCIAVVPDLPIFEYYDRSNRYEPFSIKRARDTVDKAHIGRLKPGFRPERWSPRVVVGKMLEAIRCK